MGLIFDAVRLILATVTACAVLVLPLAARAEPQLSASGVGQKRTRDESAQLRARYGVAIRSGAENDSGPGLSYSGVSPNDLALTGWLWFLFGDHLGLTAGGQREAFSLQESGRTVTSGALVRAFVGPTGRVRFGPVRLEAAAAYAFQQLPVFGTVLEPAFATVQRHGLLLAARGLVDLGPVTLEGRFEYPVALANVGRAVSSQGLGAGGGVRVQLFRTGPVKWGLLAEAQWNQDSMSTADAVPLTTQQSVVRTGLALDLQWKDPVQDETVRTASLTIAVRTEAGPLANAKVRLAGGATPRELVTGPEGRVSVPELEPGDFVATTGLEGYVPAEARLSLLAGQDKALELQLEKEKPKFGGVAITVVSFETKAAVAATVELNGQVSQTDAAGALALEGLPPGPVSIKVTAPGFNPGEEAVSIVAGSKAELTVTLVPEKKRVPATLRGQVRSARGGKPVMAQLEIREIKQSIAADETGAFSVQLPGGKYTIRIAAPGFVPQSKSVTVRDGDQAIFNVDLAPK